MYLDGSGGQFNPFTVSLGLFGLTATAGKQFIRCISFGILLQTLSNDYYPGVGVYARSLMLNIAGNKIVSRIRRRLFSSILSQESAYFDQIKTGDLISR